MGADPGAVLRLVMTQGLTVVAIGVGIALAAGRGIAGLLYGVPSTDGATFAVTIAMLVVVAYFANLVPARRASGVDSVIGLHFER